jgi:hypothetical protein
VMGAGFIMGGFCPGTSFCGAQSAVRCFGFS